MTPRQQHTLIVTDNLFGGVATHAVAFLPELAADRRVSVRFLRRPDSQIPDARVGALRGIDYREIPLSSPTSSAFEAWPELEGESFDSSMYVKGGPENGSLRLDQLLRAQGTYLTLEQNCPPRQPAPAVVWRGLRPRLGLWYWSHRLRTARRWRIPHQIVAVSRWVADGLRTEWGCPRRDIRVVMNGCDTARFRYSPEMRERARAEWGLSPDTLAIGSVGRLERAQKGVDTLFAALTQLKAQLTARPARVVLVGGGYDSEISAIRDLITQFGLDDLVLLPGPTSAPEAAWCGLDIVVLPSRFEGASLSLVEAMASERATIATAVGSVNEVLDNGRTGMIIPESGLAAALASALEWTPADRARLGAAARLDAVAHHDATQRARELVEVVRETEARNQR